MSELTKEKIYKNELEKVGAEGNNNLQRIRSLGPYATVEYVNTLMSGALKRVIVETLPTEDIDTNTIYMVLDSQSSQQGNVYNEYLYINNAWELIGTTAVSGGSELGDDITIDSTNFIAYDTYFFTPINSDNTLYRVGLVFKHKTTNESYVIVCTTDENVDSWDWDDPNNFQRCIGIIRGGDLVLKEGGSYFAKMGVVCQYTTSSSTKTVIQMLK